MINSNTFQTLLLTNTIIAVFCIILLVTLAVFIISFITPSLRRQWLGYKNENESKTDDTSSLNRQPSFNNESYGTSRFNPIFETTSGVTSTPQFSTLFHPHATTATLLHPTIWTSMTPSAGIASPLTTKSRPSLSTVITKQSSAPASLRDHSSATTAPPKPR
ncbi:unnamed protein product [Rotaria socialis]|uniref:Uncharacterized protein n=1 Tax=Rotaria socialis TaxID=392032 RepID=A0A820QFZ5_9BILA|nr:unnamed protein product [Rotaria socialis]CAF3599563.1 unnamed protein product [Rotaria socialis]CAF3732299.1 unnamed protein product [Rotaria socialis]CAF4418332.1 unnamed protein product [Rotaria socialis]CAF4451349.1 unnamed protein product [Rotaria socialis]